MTTMDRDGPGGGAATQVLISGAGPTGLLLAVELRRRGVDCMLIDELDAPRGWDRATVIHPRSLEIFEALGLAPRFLEAGARSISSSPPVPTASTSNSRRRRPSGC
jgi:2-polyprenyl-6-methoxyphenol hydroxylase-like FAD-dependent oxidoreductase